MRSCGEAAFLYLSHSATAESSGHANDAETEKDEAPPPPNRGVISDHRSSATDVREPIPSHLVSHQCLIFRLREPWN